MHSRGCFPCRELRVPLQGPSTVCFVLGAVKAAGSPAPRRPRGLGPVFPASTTLALAVFSRLREGSGAPAIWSPWEGGSRNYPFLPVIRKAEMSSKPCTCPLCLLLQRRSQIALSCKRGWDSKCWPNSRLCGASRAGRVGCGVGRAPRPLHKPGGSWRTSLPSPSGFESE